jgi:threonine dehydrogenase-like Zn-dependent dehydrogenase
MRAVVLTGHDRDPELTETATPRPGPGEVLVAMRACGICGSDVHIVEGSTVPGRLPIVLGHEAAGVVAEIGPPDGDVTMPAVGDRVTVNPMVTCGHCTMCRLGRTNYCTNIRILGLHVDGAHAEYFVVPPGNVVPLPDEVDFALGAIIADAVATPLRAIVSSGVEPGATVAVFGLGGLGLHAAMLLRQIYDAEVIGVDANDAALERAASFGIAAVVDARAGRASEEIRTITGGGVAASYEFVGRLDVVEQAVRSLDHNGVCTIVGVGPDRLNLSLRQETLVARGLRIAGSHGYLTSDIAQLLDWVASGQLVIEGTVSHRFPLDDYAVGLDALRDRSANAIRVVITNE